MRPPLSSKDFQQSRVLRERSRKGKAVARALDSQAEMLPFSRVFTSLEFEEFLKQLTPKRLQLLRLASKGGRSIADLALASHRDQGAVSRDVASLSKLGLVHVESVINQGHGLKKVVTPTASTISISAAVGE